MCLASTWAIWPATSARAAKPPSDTQLCVGPIDKPPPSEQILAACARIIQAAGPDTVLLRRAHVARSRALARKTRPR